VCCCWIAGFWVVMGVMGLAGQQGKGLITVGGAVGLSVATCHLKWADGRGQSRMIRPLDKRDERTLWL